MSAPRPDFTYRGDSTLTEDIRRAYDAAKDPWALFCDGWRLAMSQRTGGRRA